jgi:ATP-dependent RNA helicase DeaD
MEQFTKLGLSTEVTDVLKRLSFEKPSEIQEKAIPVALAGKDIIGGSATGSGKTLAFASPIIENLIPNGNVQALVLTPTRELAEQVATSIREFGQNKKLNVLAIYGGVNIQPQMKKLHSADIVVGTPGRIIDHLERRTLGLRNVKFLVLDEVDRMFDMGFSRDVEKILHECPEDRQTMLFSATISSEIDYLAQKYTNNPVEIAVESNVDPSKLKQVYYDVPDNKKFSLLVHLLKQEESNFVLVFCSTRRNVDFVTGNLDLNGIKAKAIHGGLDQKKRMRVLEEFKKQGTGVLVCTDVAARGLDIQDVTHVYNYDVCPDSKDYTHRIGRTARAGKEGKAITILANRDYENFSSLTHGGKVNIESEQLPQVGMVRIDVDFGKSERFGRNSGGRGNGRRDFGRDSRGPRRNDSRGGRDSGPRRNDSRGPRRNDGPRRNGGRDFSRGPRSGGQGRSGGNNYSRGPRNDSRPRSGGSNYSRGGRSSAPRSGGQRRENNSGRREGNSRPRKY